VSAETRDLIMFAVALVAVVGCMYYYVRGVIDEDRLLSRSAVVMFLLFGAVAAIMFVRILK
jgi:hypothetical protein